MERYFYFANTFKTVAKIRVFSFQMIKQNCTPKL